MRNITKIFAALSIAWLSTACYQESLEVENVGDQKSEVGVFGDEMRLSLGVWAPDPIEVNTRAVDPDGKSLNTLTVFCFDANGLMLSTSTAKVKPNATAEDNAEGKIDVSVPVATRIMHLVGNQNMTKFDKNTFLNKSEEEVLSILEGSAGMLIYWARVEVPANVNELYTEAKYEGPNNELVSAQQAGRTEQQAIVDWLTIETNPANQQHRGVAGKNMPIILLRNQAKFTIEAAGWDQLSDKDEWKGTYFEVTGYALCDSPAFGTIAPYNSDYGFPTYQWSDYVPYYGIVEGTKANWLDDWTQVTMPKQTDKISDVVDVSNKREQYIFETVNSTTDPVNLILRGYNIVDGVRESVERYYYRVNIVDENGEMITIRRNHHYKVNIEDNLPNGCATFAEALEAPATNNVWLSISDEVKALRDNAVELSVEKTKLIVDNSEMANDASLRTQTFQFAVKPLEEGVTLDAEKLSVSWSEADQQVSSTHNQALVVGNAVTFDTNTGHGSIRIQLNELPENEQIVKGTLLVKYGRLQRKIRVLMVRKQQFIPAWVSSEVYGRLHDDDKMTGEHVTVIFNIPESCPAELFPMKVLVTTNGLDGRASSGQVLPIVNYGDDGYGEEFEIVVNEGEENEETLTDLGYKYEFTVTEPGQKRLYFHNIFEVEDGAVEYVVLQAEYFETIARPVTYVDHQNKMLLPFLKEYTANPSAEESDVIKYMLVPQKRFAPVTFDIALQLTDGTSFGAVMPEEFLLNSTNIDHYADNDTRISDLTKATFDCYFQPYQEELWPTVGRVFGFYPRKEKVAAGTFWETKSVDGQTYDVFHLYLETNKPKSAEVVRIASNIEGSPFVNTEGKSQEEIAAGYNARTFRSVTFELGNYAPYRFAAQVNGQGSYVENTPQTGNIAEQVDDIELAYLPDEIVEVSFDITSFKGDDGMSVSPFGTGFEIFIDAPMLTLEKGMNKDMDGRDFEDILVDMFDKTPSGEQYVERKAKLEDLGNGRFVYRVDAYPGVEAGHWAWDDTHYVASSALPMIVDEASDVMPYGDRKTIRFRKNAIVNTGNIVISSNQEHISYYSKTFRVSNVPIVGSILYVPEDANGNKLEARYLPAEQFVSFSRILDDSRIGSMNVKSTDEQNPDAPTQYELRLRTEHEFRWSNDPVKIQSQIDGKYYSTEIKDIESLYNNRTITLTLDK